MADSGIASPTSPLLLQYLAQSGSNPEAAAAIPRLSLAQSMMQQGLDTSPAYPTQALTRLFQGYVGNKIFNSAMGGLGGAYQNSAHAAAAGLADGHPLKAILNDDAHPLLQAKGLEAWQNGVNKAAEPSNTRPGEQRNTIFGTTTNAQPRSVVGILANELANPDLTPVQKNAIQSAMIKAASENNLLYGASGAQAIPNAGTAQGQVKAAEMIAETPAIAGQAGAVAGAQVGPHIAESVGAKQGVASITPAGTTVVTGPDGVPREMPISAAQLPGIAAQSGIGAPGAMMPPNAAGAAPGGVLAAGVPAPAPGIQPAPTAAQGGPGAGAAPTALPAAPAPQHPIGKPFVEPTIMKDRSEAFGNARNAYAQGIVAQNQAKQLQEVLSTIPDRGPATDRLAHISAIAQQFGVPQETIAKFGLPPGANVQEAQKLSRDLLGEILKSQFPGRITNNDIKLWENTVPNTTMLPAAADYLIKQVILPKSQRDIERFGAIVDLPKTDPTLGGLDQRLMDYDKTHPLPVPKVDTKGRSVPEHSLQDIVDEVRKRGLVK